MELISDKTAWYFMLPSMKDPEDRHIYDIIYGVYILLRKGISSKDIYLLIDHCDLARIKSLFPLISNYCPVTTIYKSSDYFFLLNSNTYDNIVIFITGHGSVDGLCSFPPIKPFPFYEALKKAPVLKTAIVYFGQCEAGIFNYCSLNTDENDYNNSTIVAIGAAGLHSSLSSPSIIQEGLWSANIFLTRIFSWISKPVDVDGDGKYTVIDSFKFATALTFEDCRKIELSDSVFSAKIKTDLAILLDKLNTTGDLTMDEQLQVKALTEKLKENDYNQSPWILNVFPSMEIEF